MPHDPFDGSRVIPLTDSRAAARFPAIGEVRAYWEGLRAGRIVPQRSEVDPRGIERALEQAFVLERIAPGVARFRIAGMHLNDVMGMEVRGMPLSALFAPAAREDLGSLLEGVFDVPRSAEIALTAEPGLGKPALEARMLLLPLRADNGEISRALGCFATDGTIGRAPRRFLVDDMRISRLDQPGREARAAEAPVSAGFAEDTAAFAAAPRPARTDRPALRLVKSE